jgi:hypothetical protein
MTATISAMKRKTQNPRPIATPKLGPMVRQRRLVSIISKIIRFILSGHLRAWSTRALSAPWRLPRPLVLGLKELLSFFSDPVGFRLFLFSIAFRLNMMNLKAGMVFCFALILTALALLFASGGYLVVDSSVSFIRQILKA